MKQSNLMSSIEAILFVATAPLTPASLAAACDAAEEDVAAALESLKRALLPGGIRLINSGGAYQLTTAPAHAATVEKFIGAQAKTELSRPALETLAIIIYRQPVTKPQIEEIRGIASDQTIKNLLLRELIIEAGQSAEPGKPTLYRASHRLLHQLGISSFDELPSLEQLLDDDKQ